MQRRFGLTRRVSRLSRKRTTSNLERHSVLYSRTMNEI